MDTEEFTVSSVIPASPNRIYSAWMDERHHSAFTGARATVDPWVGGRVVSRDGFIDATHVYLVTGNRIAMTCPSGPRSMNGFRACTQLMS